MISLKRASAARKTDGRDNGQAAVEATVAELLQPYLEDHESLK